MLACSFTMADEEDAFYVVKKGNLVGIYKSLTDIQPLLSSSVCKVFVFINFLHLGVYDFKAVMFFKCLILCFDSFFNLFLNAGLW